MLVKLIVSNPDLTLFKSNKHENIPSTNSPEISREAIIECKRTFNPKSLGKAIDSTIIFIRILYYKLYTFITLVLITSTGDAQTTAMKPAARPQTK
jgi:hypothetical protein